MLKSLIILAASLSLVACASNPPAATTNKSLIEADSKMIANCDFVGTFAGRSMFGGVVAGYSDRRSLASAKAQAAAKGATHYLSGNVSAANFQQGSRTSIKGYTCK